MSRTAARFPSVPPEAGHHESFFMRTSPPEGGRSLWVRHTVHKRPNEEPTAAVWMTWFTANGASPLAIKRQVGAEELSTPRSSYIRVAESEIGPGRSIGEVRTEERAASWNLRFSDLHPPLRHLTHEWMYERSLPRTKLLSPHPAAIFDGVVDVDGERVEVDAWPGMVGHNWGTEHAERWLLISGGDRDGQPGDHIDLTIARLRVGGVLVPWIATGQIVIDGATHQLGGIRRMLSTHVDESPTGAQFRVKGPELTVSGTTGAPPHRFVGWIYSGPDGGDRHVLNCSAADLELRVRLRTGEERVIRIEGSAVYEYGSPETDHGVEIQPFADG